MYDTPVSVARALVRDVLAARGSIGAHGSGEGGGLSLSRGAAVYGTPVCVARDVC